MQNSIRKKAFSLAEVLLVLLITGFIAMFFVKAAKTAYTHYNNSLMSYSAMDSLSTATYDLAQGVGCTTTPTTGDVAMNYCTTQYSLPVIGHNAASRGFCDRLAQEEFNTAGSIDCTQEAVDGTNFKTATPAFTTANGMRFFFNDNNIGTQGLHVAYVDINGSKGNSVLNEDIIKFIVGLDGTTLPSSGYIAAENKDYLTASIRYIDGSNNYVYVMAGVNYRKAACLADATATTGGPRAIKSTYCDAQSAPYLDVYDESAQAASTAYDCKPTGTQTCEVVLDKPGLLGN